MPTPFLERTNGEYNLLPVSASNTTNTKSMLQGLLGSFSGMSIPSLDQQLKSTAEGFAKSGMVTVTPTTGAGNRGFNNVVNFSGSQSTEQPINQPVGANTSWIIWAIVALVVFFIVKAIRG